MAPRTMTQQYYSRGLRARFVTDGIRAEQAKAAANAAGYADIDYDIDEKKYLARAKARVRAGGLPTEVPAGWPTELEGPLLWSSDSFPDESEYVYTLTDADKAELLTALKTFREHGLAPTKVTKELFPLPNLSKNLGAMCGDIYEGKGFGIVRGLNPEDYTLMDLTSIYLGISSYIAETRGKQDQRGSMLIHVIKRNGEDAFDAEYGSDKPFHTDTVTDTLCLFAQSLASAGGSSVLASASTVYNELAATRPDLIHTLAAPDWPFDTFGRDPAYYRRACMYYHNSHLITAFSRRLLVGHAPFDPRTPGIPGLTEAQAEALDAIHFIAKKHEIKPRMMRGDIRFVNNMALLHRREAFENPKGEDAAKGRHLVRVWLHNEEMCWKLPGPLRLAWARVFEDHGDEREEHWDYAPVRGEGGRILRTGGSCD